MNCRSLAILGAVCVMMTLPLPAQTRGAAKPVAGAIPHTPDGHPDLQ